MEEIAQAFPSQSVQTTIKKNKNKSLIKQDVK
jgi:hypothetical protein